MWRWGWGLGALEGRLSLSGLFLDGIEHTLKKTNVNIPGVAWWRWRKRQVFLVKISNTIIIITVAAAPHFRFCAGSRKSAVRNENVNCPNIPLKGYQQLATVLQLGVMSCQISDATTAPSRVTLPPYSHLLVVRSAVSLVDGKSLSTLRCETGGH